MALSDSPTARTVYRNFPSSAVLGYLLPHVGHAVHDYCVSGHKFPAEGLLHLYAGLKILYLHRSGIENVHSRTKYAGFRAASFRRHCQVWAHGVEKFGYLRDFPAALEVPHAELLQNRDEIFRRIVEFLELPPSDRPAHYAATTLVHPLDQQTREKVDVAEALRKRKPAHEDWNDEQKTIFKDVCTEAMEFLGYEMPF